MEDQRRCTHRTFCWGLLAFLDQALPFGQPLPLFIGKHGGSRQAGVQECPKHGADLGSVRFPSVGPHPGVSQFVAPQQQIVRRIPRPVANLPSYGGLAQARVLADPRDILPQRSRQFAEGPHEGLSGTEVDIVEAPQLLRHVRLTDRLPHDGDQPLGRFGRALDLPQATLGPHRRGRQDEIPRDPDPVPTAYAS